MTGFRFVCDRWQVTASPNKELDFSFDWNRWLSYYNPKPAIKSFEVTVEGSATAQKLAEFQSGGVVSAIIDTGDAGNTLKVSCSITIDYSPQDVGDVAVYYIKVEENRRPPI